MRVVVAQIILDKNGTYTLYAPSLEQGGTIGYGDTTYGEGPANIDDTVEGVRAKLTYYHNWFMAQLATKGAE